RYMHPSPRRVMPCPATFVVILTSDRLLWQGESRHLVRAGRLAPETAGGDSGDILLAAFALISQWRAIERGRQPDGPYFLTGLEIKSPETLVIGTANENQSTASNDRPAHIG